MPRKARVKSVNGIYHVILREANKQVIFHDDEDSMRFLDILKKYKGKTGLKVYAWCLMSNHLHLLLKEGDETLSASMKRIAVSYVSYYNWKYQTTGHLFQDRFKSENVESRRYFLTVLRYIHQNPVKAGITIAQRSGLGAVMLDTMKKSIILESCWTVRRYSNCLMKIKKLRF